MEKEELLKCKESFEYFCKYTGIKFTDAQWAFIKAIDEAKRKGQKVIFIHGRKYPF